MKKALLRFFTQEDKSLCVKIVCDEELEGKEAPLIGVSPYGRYARAIVSVLDFEIDYENSGKLWFNELVFSFKPNSPDETKEGCILVEVKDKENGVINVGIQSLDE